MTGNNYEILVDNAMAAHPRLLSVRSAIVTAYVQLQSCFGAGNKLMVCGNGGSAADAEHMVTELVNRFAFKRQLPKKDKDSLMKAGLTEDFADKLQPGLNAIALGSNSALNSAIANDLGYPLVYAQQVLSYGRVGDTLFAISTSGNSENVINAIKVAKARGIYTIGLTGNTKSSLAGLVDLAIQVDSSVTADIQELHLPVYHLLCRMLEQSFFEEAN